MDAKQGEAAAEVERRHLEDQRLRGEAAGRTTDPIAAEQRRRDADIAEVARRGGSNAEDHGYRSTRQRYEVWTRV